MKKLLAFLTMLSGVCFSQSALAADIVLPDGPSERWEFFKTNYHAMPNGLKVCLILIAVIIIASIVYYKASGSKTANTENQEGGAEDGE